MERGREGERGGRRGREEGGERREEGGEGERVREGNSLISSSNVSQQQLSSEIFWLLFSLVELNLRHLQVNVVNTIVQYSMYEHIYTSTNGVNQFTNYSWPENGHS